MTRRDPRFLPLMHDAAEYLVIGQLMRRNILTYKAPPRNEGYDLICIHPNPRKKTKVVRIQVKSRYQTDSNRSVFVSESSFSAFDFLVMVFLNIGWYYDTKCKDPIEGRRETEYFVLPRSIAKRLYYKVKSGMNRIRTEGKNLDRYKNENGWELIANALAVEYPKP